MLQSPDRGGMRRESCHRHVPLPARPVQFPAAQASLLAWMVVLAGLGGGVLTLPSPTSHTFTIPGTGAQNAINLIQQRFPQANANGATARVVFAAPAGQKLSSPADKAAVEAVPTGLVGLIVAAVVLVITFRGFIAARLPLLHAVLGIGISLSARGHRFIQLSSSPSYVPHPVSVIRPHPGLRHSGTQMLTAGSVGRGWRLP